MLPSLQKHMFITAALLASLSITACNKKTETMSGPAATEQKQSDKTGDGSAADKDNGGLISDLPDVGGDTNVPSVPGGSSKPTPPPPVVDTRPAPGNTQVPNSYNPKESGNVNTDAFGKRLTGAVAEDGLLYTSSSTDTLLNKLRRLEEKLDGYTRQSNLAAAAAVTSATLSVDGLSGDAVVTLKITEGGEVKVYNIAGSNGFENGESTQLRAVREGNGTKTTGMMPVQGTLKCMDLDGGCDTTLVKIKFGYIGSESTVNVVFRNTQTDLYFSLPGRQDASANPEFQNLREMAINTIRQNNDDNKVKDARLSSWEVVNGRSGFSSILKGYNGELLGFAGPLLAPEAGTGVNITLARLNKDSDENLNNLSLTKARLNYANTIGDARLIANNSLGQIRIALTMRKRGTYKQDRFAITFMRKIKPLVELTDDTLR